MTLAVISYGGGVQSTALLVLAVRGEIPFHEAVFANVGDDTEHPETLRYVRSVIFPWARAHGFPLHEVRRTIRGQSVSLYRFTVERERAFVLPVWFAHSRAHGQRNCTVDWKIQPIARWLRARGATPENPALVALGISVDEWHRARTDSGIPWERLAYPLLDLRLTRSDCARIVQEAGLPVPPKSACWFCPFQSDARWRVLRQQHPHLWRRAVELDEHIRARFEKLGRGTVFLYKRCVPLATLSSAEQMTLPFDDEEAGCDGGWCFL